MANGSSGFRGIQKPAALRSFYVQDRTENTTEQYTASFPTGTEPPYSYMLGIKGGELSSTTYTNGSSSFSGNLSLGKFMTADLAGLGTLDASMSLITSLLADLSGSGSLSGSLSLTLGLAANLSGSGDLTGSLKLLIPLAANLTGTGTLTGNLKGNADLAADIYVNQSTATVNELVAGVWNALAADFNTSGTMGEKLNGAGSAGDPWTTDLSSYNTAGTAGKILKENPASLEIINQNVKKASKLIPASDDL